MTFLSKARRYYHTLRYLKPVQLFYQVKYRLSRVSSLKSIDFQGKPFGQFSCLPLPRNKEIIRLAGSEIKVTVLNQTITFQDRIDWAYERNGQLWNYHLQYADFLKQDNLSVNKKENLLTDLYEWLTSGKLKPEPYPASLRIMNLIRFLSQNKEDLEKENELVDYLYSELHFLEKRLEYHLLGNHLMENAFAILMGGTFFQKSEWKDLAGKIFYEQIPEQILTDGGHFERSPMYHLIVLYRFLEALTYLPSDSELHPLFSETAKKMMGWLDRMSFRNGDLAHFNDSTDHQSYSKQEIFELAKNYGIAKTLSSLSDSGYRRFETENIELLVDASGIEPPYQPGHAHADSLSFILYNNGKPIIVDPGVSTYESGERRDWERSTLAHNTVTFREQNTAGVWGKFRVAKRPDVKILKESGSGLELSLKHTLKSGEVFEQIRNFECTAGSIKISDSVNLEQPVNGHLHLHPDLNIQELTKNKVILNYGIAIKFQDIHQIQQFTYKCSTGFNRRSDSIGIRYSFTDNSSFRIIFPGT